MKKKGFSLIEVLVVLGIIGLFASFLTPKVTRYLALGKETKAISTLESLRTASEAYYFTTGEALGTKDKDLTGADLEKLEEYINSGYKKLMGEAEDSTVITIEVGGSRTKADEADAELQDIVYGGEVKFTFKDPNAASETDGQSDGIRVWMEATGDDTGAYNMQGEKWTDL